MKLEPGTPLPEFRIDPVRADRITRMAALLEDPNPIHLDPAAVEALGLGDRVINQGPANLGYAVNAILQGFPASRLTSLEARFVGTVFADDAAVAGGEIKRVADEREGETTVEVAVWVDAADRRAIEAIATLVVPTGAAGERPEAQPAPAP